MYLMVPVEVEVGCRRRALREEGKVQTMVVALLMEVGTKVDTGQTTVGAMAERRGLWKEAGGTRSRGAAGQGQKVEAGQAQRVAAMEEVPRDHSIPSPRQVLPGDRQWRGRS